MNQDLRSTAIPKKRFPPGLLVTAAFIGPGTVVTASTAGARYGCSLLWAVVFACLTTIVFQEMAARIGILTGSGLGQAIRDTVKNPVARLSIAILIVLAILVGNAAYQTGNILGAAKGAEIVLRNDQLSSLRTIAVAFIGIVAAVVICLNRFAILQNLLTSLVLLLSILFLFAALLCLPSLSEILTGLIPSIPEGSLWLLIAVLGTTVVPYNLFLHASLAANQWNDCSADEQKATAIRSSRLDTILSVSLGGVVTAAIMVSASVAFAEARASGGDSFFGGIRDIAVQLQPATGGLSPWLFGIGLFAAGLTSAITAPIAAAYAAAGCFGWKNDLSDSRLKLVAVFVVLAGVVSAIFWGGSPHRAIALAQVANGLLLPLLAVFILIIANQKSLMSKYVNSKLFNSLAMAMILVIVLLAVRQLKGGLGM